MLQVRRHLCRCEVIRSKLQPFYPEIMPLDSYKTKENVTATVWFRSLK